MSGRSRARRALLAAAAATLATACGGGEGGGGDRGTTTSSSAEAPGTSGPPTTSATTTTSAPADLTVGLRLERVATLEAPLAMVQRPGHDGFFVIERAGRLRHLDQQWRAGGALVDLTAETTTEGERGLLGVAFSPDGRRLYLSFTDSDGNSRVDEWTMGEDATAVELRSRRTLLTVGQPFSNHNGGHLTFGPDGFLWLGLGDGGAAGDPGDRAQDPADLLGSILRIDPRPSGDAPYRIPPGNPFADGGGRPEIHILGVRNPWRFSFDRATDDLWIGDVGQYRREEVNRLPPGQQAGANLGWDALEGTHPWEGEPPPDAIPPVFEYPHEGEVCAVTGGYVYRGRAIPRLAGAYLFGDLCAARLRGLAVRPDGTVEERDLGVTIPGGRLVAFAEDRAGELYVLSQEGGIFGIVAA